MTRNLLIQYLRWQLLEVPKGILRAWKNFLWFNLNFFSVPFLLMTFFSHWHKYRYSYGRGFDLWRYYEAFVFNTFSRIIGAILRTFLIITGILLEILIILIGAVIFVGWFVLPIVLIIGLVFGIELIV